MRPGSRCGPPNLIPAGGLGLAVVARILHEVSGDALATVVTREAWLRGLPDPERPRSSAFTESIFGRGAYWCTRTDSLFCPLPLSRTPNPFRRPVNTIPGSPSGPPAGARPIGRAAPSGASWARSPMPGKCPAMCPILSAAILRGKTCPPTLPGKRAIHSPQRTSMPTRRPSPPPPGITVISDFWTDHTIEKLESRGRLSEALEIAERWLELRPGRMAPRMALMRLCARTGRQERLDELEREVLSIETEDLNELEEARVGLGLLKRYSAQLRVLDRMNELAPGHAVILSNRGAVALELDLRQMAESDLQLALQLDPDNGPALTNLALLRMRESDLSPHERSSSRRSCFTPTKPRCASISRPV